MTLNDKIKQFILDRDLTSTRFADEIGVPRPSISHIMSGRNKPSLEIVQKILKKYPELGFEWVIEDDSYMPHNTAQEPNNQAHTNTNRKQNASNSFNYKPRDSHGRNNSGTKPVEPNVETNMFSNFVGQSTKQVERVVIFYSDKTWTELNQPK